MPHLRILTIALAGAALSLSACGGSGDSGIRQPPSITTQISSDSAFDGDIEQTSANNFTITQGMSASVQSVFAGIDPNALTEFRAFLDFPLSGPTGIPANATIESASLDINVQSLRPGTGTVPILIELVSMQPPTLYTSDFDRAAQPPLAFTRLNPPISPSDIGTNVSIDVTSLMVQAQQLKLPDFQVRILEDLGPAIPVLMEINDSTGSDRLQHAPLLTITYF